MVKFLYDALLYLNIGLCSVIMLVYIIAARNALPRFRNFKLAIAAVMLSTLFIYVQLNSVGDFMGIVGMDALLMRLNYTALLCILFLSGILGIHGYGTKQ